MLPLNVDFVTTVPLESGVGTVTHITLEPIPALRDPARSNELVAQLRKTLKVPETHPNANMFQFDRSELDCSSANNGVPRYTYTQVPETHPNANMFQFDRSELDCSSANNGVPRYTYTQVLKAPDGEECHWIVTVDAG